MSEPVLTVGIVAEGPSDYYIIVAALRAIFKGQYRLVPQLLQPEQSVVFAGTGDAGPLGGGWKGVGKWCLQAARRGGGRLRDGVLLFDVLIVHIDADVAGEQSEAGSSLPGLPCERLCPPADATTNALRAVLLSWMGESSIPERLVFCTPSKSTEAWVLAAFFESDGEMKRLGPECHPKPEVRLAQQPKAKRFGKADYREKAGAFTDEWPRVCGVLTEASRFQSEMIASLQRRAG